MNKITAIVCISLALFWAAQADYACVEEIALNRCKDISRASVNDNHDITYCCPVDENQHFTYIKAEHIDGMKVITCTCKERTD